MLTMLSFRNVAAVVLTLILAGCADVVSSPSAVPPTAAPSPTPSAVPTPTPSTMPTPTLTPTAEPTASPTAEPTPSPEPTATAIAQREGLIVDWRQMPDAGLDQATSFAGIAAADGLYLAIGDAGDDFQSTAWTSDDGLHWAGAPFGTGLTLPAAITSAQPGFIVVGWEFPGGYVAISPDGVTWQRVDDPIFAEQDLRWVGTIGTATIAFTDAGAAFATSDAQTWEAALDPGTLDVADGLLGLTSDGEALWAFSLDGDEPRANRRLVEVWRSTDLTWTQVGVLADSQGAQSIVSSGGPNGLVAIAQVQRHNDYGWATWYSVDGSAWQAATNSPRDIVDVLADQAGFVAVGYYNVGQGCALIETDDVGVTWTSVDGSVWRQMPEDGWMGREIHALALNGRTLIGLGIDWNEHYDGAGDSGVLWTAELPEAALDEAPLPSPAPTPEPGGSCG